MKILDFLNFQIAVKDCWDDVTLRQFMHLTDPNPLDIDQPSDLFMFQWKLACLTNLKLIEIERLSISEFETLVALIRPLIAFADIPCSVQPMRTFKHEWDWDSTGYPYPRFFEMQQVFDNEPFGKYMMIVDLMKKIESEKMTFEDSMSLSIATVFHEVKKPTVLEQINLKKSESLYDTERIPLHQRAFLDLPLPVAYGANAFFLKQWQGLKERMDQYLVELQKEATRKSSSPKNSE